MTTAATQTPLQKAAAVISSQANKLAKLERLLQSSNCPIAIVAIAARFPHAGDVAGFWRLLHHGESAIGEIPADRFDIDAYYDPDPEVPGKLYTRFGGFIDGVDQFDAAHFRISPREARSMDPQQRLLMETAWVALEQGVIPAESLRRSRTGVYVGVGPNEYGSLLARSGDQTIDAYFGTGNSPASIAGRLAFVLGLQGPAMSIDTACSSSLVAVHQACLGLRNGDCDMALAGGVSVLLSTHNMLAICRARMLSADGRCKTFDEAADGYVRGEGCGVVVLKRLRDAERDGDRILAVIRGSAINHDGASSGFTVPNGPSQERVIADALQQAGVAPSEVIYLEAHGTGTSLGDPIEVQSAVKVLGKGRSFDKPLLIGSVKTNIGHLEAAAGIAGLIKVVLALQHGTIPQSLHFRNPNPHIPWDQLPVKVVTESTPWPEGCRIAGLSSFGFTGTNAHVVLAAYDSGQSAVMRDGDALAHDCAFPERSAHLLALSGSSESALRELAARYVEWLAGHADAEDSELADVCFTAGTGRSHLEYRAGVVAKSREQLIDALQKLAVGEDAADVCPGRIRQKPKVALLFTGQGSQYVGMAKALYASQPVFKGTLDRCAALIKDQRDEPLLDVIFEDVRGVLDQTHWTQPALFSVEVALYEMYRSLGVEVDAVLGHSVGEYAAAYAAGVLSLEDGLNLTAKRGALFGDLPIGGSMAAVFARPEQIETAVERSNNDSPSRIGLSIAAYNGAHGVISGPTELVERVVGQFEAEGVRCARLETSHAFHSALLEPALDAYEGFAATIEYRLPQRTLISNLTGAPLGPGRALDAAYWRRHAREPVQFARSVAALAEAGIDVLLELGPQSTLTAMSLRCWGSEVLPTGIVALSRDLPADFSLIKSSAQLYAAGCSIDFAALDAGHRRRKISLPSYPFQRQRHWIDIGAIQAPALSADSPPLPGRLVRLAGVDGERRFEILLRPDAPAMLGDHRVGGVCVLPASGMVEMAVAALPNTEATPLIGLEDLNIQKALVLDGDRGRVVQTIVDLECDGLRPFRIYSRSQDDGSDEPWVLHASGKLWHGPQRSTPLSLSALQASITSPVDVEGFYRGLRRHGVVHGPIFQVIAELWIDQSSGRALGRIRLNAEPPENKSQLWTVLVDACIQTLSAALDDDDSECAWLPVALERFIGDRKAVRSGSFWCYGSLRKDARGDGDEVKADAWISGDGGEIVAELKGLQLLRTRGVAVRGALTSSYGDWFYQLHWQHQELAAPSRSSAFGEHWLLLGDAGGTSRRLACLLREEAHVMVTVATPGSEYLSLGSGEYQLDAEQPDQVRRWLTEACAERAPVQVVHLAGLDTGTDEPSLERLTSDYRRICGSAIHLVQSLVDTLGTEPPRLTFVTRGAVPVMESDVPSLGQAPLWGLANVLAVEHPELHCLRLDLDSDAVVDIERLLTEIRAQDREDRVAYRGKERLVARLQRSRGLLDRTDDSGLHGDATYLITGGTGELGIAVAEWLVERGARYLLLMGRRDASAAAMSRLAALERAGAQVTVAQVDIAQRDTLETALDTARRTLPPLRGVIHAAGVLDDGVLMQQTWQRFADVLAPKVRGGWLLYELTQSLDLQFFISFSSLAALFGAPGQSNYAAANAFLDAMAHYQRRNGYLATSINWAAWAGLGMAGRTGADRRATSVGINGLSRKGGLDALGAIMHGVAPHQIAVADIDWALFVRQFGPAIPPMIEALVPVIESNKPACSDAKAVLEEIKGATAEELGPLLDTYLRQSIGQIMGLELDAHARTRSLTALGIDSLMALELKKRIGADLGVDVQVRQFVGDASISTIADLILERMRLASLVMAPGVGEETDDEREVFTL